MQDAKKYIDIININLICLSYLSTARVHNCSIIFIIAVVAVVVRSRQAAWVAVAMDVVMCVGSKLCGCERGVIMVHN